MGYQQIPVTILTGFLGSGKTTLLNRILKDKTHGMKFAIIENEIGDVSVDDKVIKEDVKDEFIEVMNGCICCTVRGDLVKSLKKLYKRLDQFDGVIIETTGLANPSPVCQTFFVEKHIKMIYRLDAVITVVDSKYIMERLAEKKPGGEENEPQQQIAWADKVLLNKVDLSTEEELKMIEAKIKSINPTCSITRCEYSKVSPKELLNIEAFELRRVLDLDADFLDEFAVYEHNITVSNVAVKVEGSVNMAMLETWIQRLIGQDSAKLYRYKGIISVKGMPNKFVFQGVGMTFTGGFCDISWEPGEKRESRFVFIGKDLADSMYREGFLACKADKPLRFNVGDFVEANVGTYEKAKILKQWDEGNAYRLELQNETKMNFWAPVDIDDYLRPLRG